MNQYLTHLLITKVTVCLRDFIDRDDSVDNNRRVGTSIFNQPEQGVVNRCGDDSASIDGDILPPPEIEFSTLTY